MKDFIESHTYLMSLLIWLFFYLLGFIIFYKNKTTILISSLAALPQAFYALDLVPKAWVPDRVFQMKIGFEDLIFCFLAGGLVWMSSLWFTRKHLLKSINYKILFKNLGICYLFGITASTIMFWVAIDGYMNPFIVMVIWSVFLIVIRKQYWRIAALSMVSFFSIWFLIAILIISIWPEIPSLWSWNQLSGEGFLEFPIEELIWAVLYSISWSLSIAFVLDVRLKPLNKPEVNKDINY